MKGIHNWTPEAIYYDIISNDRGRNRTYIIFGRPGPTGKSWLCNVLRTRGYSAMEISEALVRNNIIDSYADDKNHYIVDESNHLVIIVLNKILPKYEKKFVTVNKDKFEKLFFRGSFEDLISDLDDIYDRYTLLVNHNGVCEVYEPDEIDYSFFQHGEYKVKHYTINDNGKGVVVDVYI